MATVSGSEQSTAAATLNSSSSNTNSSSSAQMSVSLQTNLSSSNSMFFVVNPLPSTDDQFNDRILETIDRIRNQSGSSSSNFPVLHFNSQFLSQSQFGNINNEGNDLSDTINQQQQPQRITVQQCVIGHSHIAVLLDDNRICRFSYTIYADRINGQSEASNKKLSYSPTPINATGGNGGASSTSGTQRIISSHRTRRLVRRGGSRGSSSSVIMSRSHVIPAQYVPDELVNQAQVVLQGKSRNVIVRELQRTNLDVNLAVNNLLSRDDEDFEDADDSPDHLIHSDDLISLLDSGFHNDHSVIIDPDFSDEMFSYPLRIRSSNSSIFHTNSNTGGSSGAGSNLTNTSVVNNASERRSIRLREDSNPFIDSRDSKRWYTVNDNKRSAIEDRSNIDKSSSSKKQSSNNLSSVDSFGVHQLAPISISDQPEYWSPPKDKHFIAIAALYSELIALTNTGQLCQWRWTDVESYVQTSSTGVVMYHPKVLALGLVSEKVTFLSASCIRATVVTESNKVATWMDESIASIASKLEHSATNAVFNDILTSSTSGTETLKISCLYVSSLMSCVQLSSGSLFWWGIPPFSHRKKMSEKIKNERTKSSKSTKSLSSSSITSASKKQDQEIIQGAMVCMRNSPIYQSGAIAFTTVGGVPKVGQLTTAAWKLSDSCSFRVLSNQEIKARSSSLTSSSSSSSSPFSSATVTNLSSSSANNLIVPSSSSQSNKNSICCEMPPPPSPASSTSSESSLNNSSNNTSKRTKSRSTLNTNSKALNQPLQDSNDSDKTEIWNLRDVVFIEDVKNMPVGRVLKVDGSYVAVLTQPNDRETLTTDPKSDNIESIQNCRLMRKDDLVVVKSSSGGSSSNNASSFHLMNQTFANSTTASSIVGNTKAYDCLQKFPRRVHIPEHVQILAMTLSNLGLHAIAKVGGYRYSYLQINIVTGRIEYDAKLSIQYSAFFGGSSLSSSSSRHTQISLFSSGETENTTVVVCRDGNGTLYPLAKDCTDTAIREPISLNLGPVSTVALGVFALPPQSHPLASTSAAKTHAVILSLTIEPQALMTAILKSDLELLRNYLQLFETNPQQYQSFITEVCDGNRNVIHVAVSKCFSTSNRQSSSNDVNLMLSSQNEEDDIVILESGALNSENNTESGLGSSSAHQNNQHSQTQQQQNQFEPLSESILLDPGEQKPISHWVLWTLLESQAMSRHLFDLLSARDYQGFTPFMLAVSGRAYSAAQQLFIVIQKLAKMISNNENQQLVSEENASLSQTSTNAPASQPQQQQTSPETIYQRAFYQMIYPRGSSPDHSPLYMLCSNDTCSFTWTGDEHINQDIFECRTCGLVGSLCCCTECARVCHRGHDCKLKRTSPTAYCDCWEKCKCKSLISGCQPSRYQLLKRLLSHTDLSQRVNSRHEHILLFLVQTVGRQIIEQKQYRPARLRSFAASSARKTDSSSSMAVDEGSSNVPEHDLEPPKFARRALEKLLGDWPTVKSMILTGYRTGGSQATGAANKKNVRSMLWNFNGTANAYAYEEENAYLSCQNGSALLDKFTHSLLRIGLNDAIDRIASTIVSSCKTSVTANEGKIVARRFVRSVARVCLVIFFEINPIQYAAAYPPLGVPSHGTYVEKLLSSNPMPSSRTSGGATNLSFISSSSLPKKSALWAILRKCRKVFISFLPIALEELCEIAISLIAPVKLGLARPSASFHMMPNSSEAFSITDELFSVDSQIFEHQRDFLEGSSFGSDLLEEPLAYSSESNINANNIWNSYEAVSADSDNVDIRAASSSNMIVGSQEDNNSQHESGGDSARIGNDIDMQSLNLADVVPSSSLVYDLSQSNDSTSSLSNSGPSISNSNHQQPEIIIHQRILVNDENSLAGGNQEDIDILLPDDSSNAGGRIDTESDSESNPDDASYLSNADNASAQRSVVTGATAGSDVGVASLTYDDESLNSNPDEVEEDDDDEEPEIDENDDDSSDSDASDTVETEPETEVFSSLIGDNIERRPALTTSTSNRSAIRNSLMAHVSWALRGRDSGTGFPANNGNSSNNQEAFPFSRRNNVSNALVNTENVVQITNSMVGLARAFAIILRHIADLLPIVLDSNVELPVIDFPYLYFNPTEAKQLHGLVEERLQSVWIWLINSMDTTETQLRFGYALSNRRVLPSSSTTTSSANGVSGSLTGSLTNASSLSSTSAVTSGLSGVAANRMSRIRTFQSQDEMAMLPSFARTTSFRRGRHLHTLFSGGSSSSSSTVRLVSDTAGGGGGVNGGTAAGTGGTGASRANGVANNSVTGGGNASTSGTTSAPFLLDSNSAHRDFLNYALSLMRAHSNEHYDSLPVLDVTSLKHLAYIFDAFVYFIRRGVMAEMFDHHEGSVKLSEACKNLDSSLGQNHPFFRRSSSTLFLGCPKPDPFSAPYHEALPLASKPHLLQPNARREQLFGIPRPSNACEAEEMLDACPSQMSYTRRMNWSLDRGTLTSISPNNAPQRSQSVIVMAGSVAKPTASAQQHLTPKMLLKQSFKKPSSASGLATNNDPVDHHQQQQANVKIYFFGNTQQQDVLLGRWRLSLELFGRLYVDDVSLEPHSIINELSAFSIKESRFRREMERLRISVGSSTCSGQRDLNFNKLDRDRNLLLQQTFKELNIVFSSIARRLPSQISMVSQPLTITRVKVMFKDEPGEGTGVARSFYTAFSEAVLSNENLSSDVLSSSSLRHSSQPSLNEAYSNYVLRLRSHSGNTSQSTSSGVSSAINGGSSTSTLPLNRSSSGASSAPPNASSSPVNDSPSNSNMRRPRSPGRYRFLSTARRTQLIERIRTMHEARASTGAPLTSTRRILSHVSQLRYEAAPFVPTSFYSNRIQFHYSPNDSRNNIGFRLFNRVHSVYPGHAAKITGMLLELYPDVISIMNSEEELRLYMDNAMDIINQYESNRVTGSGSSSSSSLPTNVSQSSSNVSQLIDIIDHDQSSSTSASAQQQQQSASSTSISSLPLEFILGSLSSNIDSTNTLSSGNGGSSNRSSSSVTSKHVKHQDSYKMEIEQFDDNNTEDTAPLFYQPGPRGFYSPRGGKNTEARLNAFRNVGRIIGVCFIQNELCPISFNRHVIKTILDQPVSWHDLAFFDSDLYESLRQLILDAESPNKEEIFSELDFRFAIDVSFEEGGGEDVEIVENGRNIKVTPQNVYEYVRLYALHRMINSQEKAILAIRAGIFDVIPQSSFFGLTAEDFRLLLNGVNEINVQLLQTYVTFYDESGDTQDATNYFRRWFWWVVERMTNEERQDLIYFWTGSPALPASEEGFQPMPSVTIRPRDDNYFVTANTCISRLYIPLYSSRSILRQKLSVSIKSKSFGFI